MRKSARIASGCAVAALAFAPMVLSSGTDKARASTPPIKFSHEVVVDEQRDGFEPDIQVSPNGTYFTSVPNGSSSTLSFIWTSTDGGNTFHIVPGNLASTGRLLNCPQGGGDTEEILDAKGNLFFSDLQNLSNLTNSVSQDGGKTFTSSCLGAVNSPVDRMWYALQGTLGSPNFRIYEEYDAVDSKAPSPGNQLVLEASNDGLVFAPVINPKTTSTPGCIGGGLLNCVTGDEGISGNVVLEPNGNVLMVHTSGDGNLAVATTGVISGTFPALTGSYRNVVLNSSLCPDFPVDSSHVGKSEICGATNFETVAEDSGGGYYAAFASQKQTDENIGGSPTLVPSGPYEVYVASSRDGIHWSNPVQVSHSGSNAFAWITAGSPGRVAVAWYSTDETHERPGAVSFSQSILNQLASADPHGYAFDELSHAEFNIDVAETTNGLSSKPTYNVVTASEHPIKYGPICTFGTLCEVTQGDRSLGDFLEIKYDQTGALVLSYVDDTSGFYATGPTGAVADNGPPVVIRQISGPSLLASHPVVNGPGKGPSQVMSAVGDPAGDDFYSADGTLTPAGTNLDLTGASLSRDASGLVATMKVKSLASLLANPLAGGTTGVWVMRFTTFDPHTLGNGHIYYAAMQSIAGQKPTFYAGEPTRIKQLTSFDSTKTVPGSYNPADGTITIHIPFSVIGNHSAKGTMFYSVTAFTATTIGTIAGVPLGLLNVVDSTTPFGYALAATPRAVVTKSPATTARPSNGSSGAGGGGSSSGNGSGSSSTPAGAGSGSAGSSLASGAAAGSTSSGLSFTGIDALAVALLALVMVGLGFALVSSSRLRRRS